MAKRLEDELGARPSIEQIAQALGEKPEKIAHLFDIAKEPISLATPIGGDGSNRLEDIISAPALSSDERSRQQELREFLFQLIIDSKMNAKQQKVIIMRYGLATGEPQTLEEIGNKLGLTRERIRQIEKEALRILKFPFIREKLTDYLEDDV